MAFVLLFMSAILFPRDLEAGFIDRSHEVFFPHEIAAPIRRAKSFPVFRWNFISFEYQSDHVPIQETCALLTAWALKANFQVSCDTSQTPNALKDWILDAPLRRKAPDRSDWKAILNRALAQASLPLAPIGVLQLDPLLESFEYFKIRSEFASDENSKQGYWVDTDTHRLVWPIEFTHGPEYTKDTQSLVTLAERECSPAMGCTKVSFLGPHFSTLENQSRIMTDLQIVSWMGLLILVCSCLFLYKTRRTRLLALFPPVGVGCIVASIATWCAFGSVHGLTLSFGIGMIGMALDYGVHASFPGPKQSVWKSNFWGWVTTMIVFVVLLWSEIPLLKQMAFFSMVGLTVSFAILRWMSFRNPQLTEINTFDLTVRRTRYGMLATTVLALGSIIPVTILPIQFSLDPFDYRSPETKLFRQWFTAHVKQTPPLILATPRSAETILEASQRALVWSRNEHIPVDTVALYLRSPHEQEENLEDWPCREPKRIAEGWTLPQATFFQPFVNSFLCPPVRVLNSETMPAYLHHLISDSDVVTMWFPKTSDDKEKIQAAYPEAISLPDLFTEFPKLIHQEFKMFSIISIVAVIVVLAGYYRRGVPLFTSVLPFLSGVGLVGWTSLILKIPLSFVSLMGLLMIFGMSIDYGIFASDGRNDRHVASALLLAGVSTILGFVPLLFCHHPVLFQLGHVLTAGTIGNLLGAFGSLRTDRS